MLLDFQTTVMLVGVAVAMILSIVTLTHIKRFIPHAFFVYKP